VFSVLAETLRLQVPQIYMMSLGLLLILAVLYLPGGLASLRADTFRGWRDSFKAWWAETKDDLSGETKRRKQRETQLRERRDVF
jgi:branched-chain amino acid transport system permease protein